MIVWIVAGLIVLFFAFRLGMVVGYRQAYFSYRWGENYHRNFGGPRGGFFEGFFSDRKDFIESHGTFGQIVKIDFTVSTSSAQTSSTPAATLVVKGGNDVEKIILVKDDAVITRFRQEAKLADLKVGDYIVVIGRPNDSGQIEAKLIRIMPPPPFSISTSSASAARPHLFY